MSRYALVVGRAAATGPSAEAAKLEAATRAVVTGVYRRLPDLHPLGAVPAVSAVHVGGKEGARAAAELARRGATALPALFVPGGVTPLLGPAAILGHFDQLIARAAASGVPPSGDDPDDLLDSFYEEHMMKGDFGDDTEIGENASIGGGFDSAMRRMEERRSREDRADRAARRRQSEEDARTTAPPAHSDRPSNIDMTGMGVGFGDDDDDGDPTDPMDDRFFNAKFGDD